jgi:hypothetical protein
MLDTLVLVFVTSVAFVMLACLVFTVLMWMFWPVIECVLDRLTFPAGAFPDALLERDPLEKDRRCEAIARAKSKAKRLAEERRQAAFRHDCAMSGYPGSGINRHS